MNSDELARYLPPPSAQLWSGLTGPSCMLGRLRQPSRCLFWGCGRLIRALPSADPWLSSVLQLIRESLDAEAVAPGGWYNVDILAGGICGACSLLPRPWGQREDDGRSLQRNGCARK